eukprot:CAMPEP_0197665272 /NCGR_PEP_ID=MMETSP1338-20131121/59130_1 /TAXON_ID=43686 ORGANISM="Pelagodinium beii, Strain RCC1491" /NCGR_SAMPLE_ID=MMETSP1338 /ASSEMBLY_ACC=CAM_ASM_000754 /LENGTH=155 /DNA_ID=CAMNT_0043244049 /DNA_START=109 /DNA_END=576 /DNA_ORIENTATION=+
MKTVGGEVGAASALAPKVGPLGLSPKKIGEDICKATGEFKGIKCTVKLTVINRVATVELVPSSSALVLKALGEPPRDRKKDKANEVVAVHDGDLTLDAVIDIARTMRPRSLARTLAGGVKEILGTCFSIGCTVNGAHPSEITRQINDEELVIPDE